MSDADGGHEASGLSGFFAVTEEEVPAAGGTEIAHRDVLRTQARVEELSAIGLAKIQQNVFR